MHNELSRKIQKVHNFESLVSFLRDSFNWPIPEEGLEFEDITYEWSAANLDLDTQTRVISCRQLRLFNLEFDLSAVGHKLNPNTDTRQQLLIKLGVLENQQPWGIFFIQFDDDVELDACRTLLRRVLRGLVDRRGRSVSLPFGNTINFSLSVLLRTFKVLALLASVAKKVVLLLMTISRSSISNWMPETTYLMLVGEVYNPNFSHRVCKYSGSVSL